MTLSRLVIPWLVAAGVAAVATPLVAMAARRLGIVDRPDERKVSNRGNMPLLGGLAVALGFFAGLAVALMLGTGGADLRGYMAGQVSGSLLLIALGVVDDRRGLSAWPKLAVQLAAASIAIYAGFRIESFSDPVTLTRWYLPMPLVWLVTLAWIVGITNAMNLMDGLDGLATGLGAIIGVTLTWISYQANEPAGVVVGVVFVGALLGFLPYNFPVARIFLGDTGSLLIGFNLSLLALAGSRRMSVLTFVVPLLALAVPLLDTTLSIYRRIRRRRSILSADRHHIHHRLLESEGSHRAAVLSIWFLTACFCVIAVSFANLSGWSALFFLTLVIFLTLRLLRNLGFFDVSEPPAVDRGPGAASGHDRG